MRKLFTVCLWLALTGSPGAEPMELTVRTYPPGASMRDQFGNQLGQSGGPVVLDWNRAKGTLQLELSKAGHRKVTRTLSFREVAVGVYPEDGEVALPPNNAWVRVQDFAIYQTGRLLTALTLSLAVLGAVVVKVKSSKTLGQEHPEQVGRYILSERLGQGATAEVFQAVARDDPDSLAVALKLMKESDQLDGQSAQRFRQEIKTSLSLRHPNLVSVYDWGEHQDGRLFLVTELLRGQTLRQKLRENSTPDPHLVVDLLQALQAGLDYLHDRGLVHRDVKPDNVFLTDSSEVKLMDLGIAKGDDAAPLTRAGTAMGTPHYMAPEQIRGQAVPASDQYALGVMTFEMLTGTRPYKGADGLEILQKHLSDPVPLVSSLKDYGPLVDDAVSRAMAKNVESRFPDLASFVETLCFALQQEGEGLDTAASVVG